jgi:hypothetical protein
MRKLQWVCFTLLILEILLVTRAVAGPKVRKTPEQCGGSRPGPPLICTADPKIARTFNCQTITLQFDSGNNGAVCPTYDFPAPPELNLIRGTMDKRVDGHGHYTVTPLYAVNDRLYCQWYAAGTGNAGGFVWGYCTIKARSINRRKL